MTKAPVLFPPELFHLQQKVKYLEITIYFCYKKAAVENLTAAQGVING
jgi:hypothetical protein